MSGLIRACVPWPLLEGRSLSIELDAHTWVETGEMKENEAVEQRDVCQCVTVVLCKSVSHARHACGWQQIWGWLRPCSRAPAPL